jgi:hypothetical protein
MRILGIIASSIQKSADSYDSIQTVTVGAGGAPSITFSSIPNNYKHLQIRWIGRVTAPTSDENLQMRVGSGSIDSGANYSQHYIYGNGTSALAGGNANFTGSNLGRLTGANSTAGNFGAGIIDIIDYANTGKNKTFRSISSNDQNGQGLNWIASGAYFNTVAINTIQFNQLYGSGNFAQGSQFALYGIRG